MEDREGNDENIEKVIYISYIWASKVLHVGFCMCWHTSRKAFFHSK